MMTNETKPVRHGQRGRIDAATMSFVGQEIDAYMKRPCSRARADGLTPLQAIQADTRLKVLAMEEWRAMRPDGSLPDWWPAKRAEIEARIAALTPAQQEVGHE